MPLDYQKELTPVLYDASGIKIRRFKMKIDQVCFSTHWHERMELVLVSSGSLHFRVKNYEETLTPGQLGIIPPEHPHRGVAGKEGVSFETVMFDIRAFYNGTSSTDRFLKPMVEQKTAFLPCTDQPEIITLVREILMDYPPEDSYASLTKIGKAYELIAALHRYCLAEKETTAIANDRLRDVFDYIDKHFCERISSAELSRKFGYSEGYFCRQFKAVTGLSPMIYIRILRLEKARKLISEQRLSIGEIAAHCGFSDISYFTQCFKSHYHMTPTDFARKH